MTLLILLGLGYGANFVYGKITDGKDLIAVIGSDKSTAAEEKALFWGGLSGILGYWLPSPPESKDKQLAEIPKDEVL